MKLSTILVGVGALVALNTTVARAQNVLWFEDAVEGTSSFSSGMSALGTALPGANIYNATSTSDFFTSLTGGSWDLAILGEQNTDITSASLGDISSYLTGGGLWLGTSWLGGSYLTLLDAASVDQNATQISDNGSASYGSIWGVSPINLMNPGWGTFSQSYSALNGAACVGSLGSGCAAILGNGGRSLLLGPLSDTYVDATIGSNVVLGSSLFLLDQDQTSTVPEPMTMTLLATGLVGIAAARRKRRTT